MWNEIDEGGVRKSHTHQATEPFECAWYSHMGVDLDEDAFCGVNVYLEQAGLVERRVEECQQALNEIRWREGEMWVGLPGV